MCSHGQLSELEMVRDIDLDLGWADIFQSCVAYLNAIICENGTADSAPPEVNESQGLN